MENTLPAESPLQTAEPPRSGVAQLIVDAARDLFAAHGYEAVTMRKIADSIGYSATTIYNHFADKLQLMRELCNGDFRKLAHEMRDVAQLPDPLDRLRETGRGYVRFALNHPNSYRLMFMTPHPALLDDSPEAQAMKGNPEQDAYALLKRVVTDCMEAGRLRPEYKDADLVAQLLWSGVHGLISLLIVMGNDDWVDWRPVDQLVEKMLDVQMNGLMLSQTAGSAE